MKEKITIKLEKEDFDHLKKWIENTIEITKYIKIENKWIEWQKKMIKILKEQEDNLQQN